MTCMVNAIPIDSQYMIAPSLQQGFIDKDSGELLAFGVVTFYRDEDHTTLKPIYTISGPPDDPIFTELPNPLTLSAIGTFIDKNNGQDIIPYYKPYDDAGNIDLYYITVYNADGVLQFTRDHYPTVIDGGENTVILAENLIPNGQFLMHLDLPDGGLIPDADHIVPIAYGGWKFEQDANSSSVNYVNFIRYDAPSNTPDQNPRYSCEVKCTVFNPADSQKQIYCLIENVNFMQGQDLTFQFTAYSQDGNNHSVNFIIRKTYGAGGSADTEENIATVVVTPQIQNFTINFTMSSNNGKVIGPNNDDVIAITLQSPLSALSVIRYVDILLVPGTFSSLEYPPTTPAQDIAFTMGGSLSIPKYDGSDSGKYVQLGLQTPGGSLGFIYTIPPNLPAGTIIMSGSTVVPDTYLPCDGSGYPVSNLVYQPLFTSIGYNYGTGVNGFINTAGIPTNELVITWNRYDVSQPTPNAGTSGFVFTLVQASVPTSVPQIYALTVNSGAMITPGSYYTQTVNTTGTPFVQLFWFSVDGVGTIPSVPFDVSVEIPVGSSDTAEDVRGLLGTLANGLFAVPDMRGFFPRFISGASGRDPDANTRAPSASGGPFFPGFPYLMGSGNSGNNLGSLQESANLAHNHPDPTGTFPDPYIVRTSTLPVNWITSGEGGFQLGAPLFMDGEAEARSLNIYVNGFIKM